MYIPGTPFSGIPLNLGRIVGFARGSGAGLLHLGLLFGPCDPKIDTKTSQASNANVNYGIGLHDYITLLTIERQRKCEPARGLK